MSSEHPWRVTSRKLGMLLWLPGEVKARDVALAASTKVRVEAMGMNEKMKELIGP